jgi:hypothetical protein
MKENSPTSFVVEQTLQTMVGAKTLALDTKTNHLLTMAAEFGPPPTDAPLGPAGRPARGPMVPGSFSILMVASRRQPTGIGSTRETTAHTEAIHMDAVGTIGELAKSLRENETW